MLASIFKYFNLCTINQFIAGIEFSDEIMQNAVSITKKFDNFISDCDNYVAGKFKTGEIDENLLFTVNNQFFILLKIN